MFDSTRENEKTQELQINSDRLRRLCEIYINGEAALKMNMLRKHLRQLFQASIKKFLEYFFIKKIEYKECLRSPVLYESKYFVD